MVEVFKTNVEGVQTAATLIEHLQSLYPDARITFDLEDCDRILRIAPKAIPIEVDSVVELVQRHGQWIELLK